MGFSLRKAVNSVGDGIEHGVDKVKKKAGEIIDDGAHIVGDGLDHVGLDDAADWVEDQGDHIADNLGAHVAEQQLGQTDDPKELLHGDPAKIREAVLHLAKLSLAFDNGHTGLSHLDPGDWDGAGADAFRAKFKPQPAKWAHAATACAEAGLALETYAETVDWAIGQAKEAVRLWKQGVAKRKTAADAYNASVDTYHDDVKAYNDKVDDGKDPGTKPVAPAAFTDPGAKDKQTAKETLDAARKQRDNAATTAETKVQAATKLAPAKPDFTGRMKNDLGDVGKAAPIAAEHFAGGLVRSLTDLEKFARGLNPTDPYNLTHPAQYLTHLNATAAGLVDMTAHPERLPGIILGTGWGSDGSEAGGRLVGNILLAIATDGGSAAGKTVAEDAAKNAAKDAAEQAVKNGARAAAEDPAKAAIEQAAKKCLSDPIDVATGDMILTQTDITLPGTLPLVLERTHLSSYRIGRFFGPSWASTLDQRLELDDQGVVFVNADGSILLYPVPRPGAPALPAHGPRWPLEWDGTPGAPLRITKTEAGHTLHFAAVPGATASPGDPMQLPLTEVTDRNGNSYAITHDADGVPAEILHSGGYHLTLSSDSGRITALHLQDPSAPDEPATLVRKYGYDAVGNLTGLTNSSGLPHQFSYDAASRITSWTDRNDTTYAYTYDQRGRCVATSGTDGFLSSTFAYDDATRTTTFTNSVGHRSTYTHNAAYRLISETDPLGHTTRREWDTANRRLVALTDPLNHTIRYSYDSDGNLVSLVRPDGAFATAEYNVFGLPLRISEPGGAIWTHTYDDFGALLSTTDPAGAVTRYHRNFRGALVGRTDPLGRTHRYEVNAAGLPMGTTDPLGHTTHVERDDFGHLTAFTDPLGCTTRMEWTPDGKPKWRESTDGARETWRWDGEGNLTAFSDPAGHTTRYTYTHFDLVASRSGPNGAVRTFEYDTELRLRQVTDALGHHWTYTYDPAGRLTSERDFSGRTLTYTLNAAGQLIGRTNGAGETHAFVLDCLGRVTEQRASTGEVATYTYDDAGRLVSAANSVATLSYVRDELGRPLTETVNDRTTRYTYDAAGRRTSRTTPSGHVSAWTYDAVGRPEELVTSAGSLTLAHDAAGRETERRIGGNLLLTQRWDTTGRLTGQAVVATQPAQAERLLNNRTYAYRDDGYLAEVQDVLDGTRRYDLDAVGRITAVHASTGTEIYDYDATGNLTRAMVPGNAGTPTDRDFSGAIIRRSGRTVYQHDAQGRLVRKTLRHLSGAKKTWTYAWNAEDRLVRAVTPDGLTWRYTYDPLGRRIAKLHSLDGTSHTTTFAWEGTRLAEERSPEGRTTTWDYAPGTHTALAQTTSRAVLLRPDPNSPASPPPGPPSSSGADLSFYAVITDPVGSPTELVAQDATIPWHSRHDVWGVAHPASESSGEAYCPLRFPGQYADDETGFNYNYHRYYDPETARYISPDPLGLIPADNHYGYVDNPLAWQDALGLAPCKGYDLRGKDPMSIVPDDAKIRELTPHSGGGSQYGLEYSWKNDAGQTVRLRIHGPDGTAPVGSNSASGETYRIQIGRQYQDEAGNLYHHQSHNPNSPNYNPNAANATHIPWPSEYPGL